MEFFTDEVIRIKSLTLIPAKIPVYAYIHEVKSGKLIEVPTAIKADAVN